MFSRLSRPKVRDILPLAPSTVVVRCDGFIEAELDNEIVALNIEKGTCYGLNRVGSRIWRLLTVPTRIDDICSRLLAEYNVDAEACEREVIDLLEELRSEGMIAVPEKK